jgi:hypothetical protein
MNEQAKIQDALEEEAEGPSAELRRGAGNGAGRRLLPGPAQGVARRQACGQGP